MKKPAFLKQKMMLRVLQALSPVALAAVYFFGWRVLGVLALATGVALLTEWVMVSTRPNGKISQACFVTAAIYALSLPPTIPYWITAVGAVVAILFAKEAFGGFGKNVFNPAVVGRAFVYVCFPIELTSQFVPVFNGFPGGFTHWSPPLADGMTAATPMWSLRDYGHTTSLWQLAIGNIGGRFEFEGYSQVLAAGSVGEVSGLLLLLSAIYLVWTKTAQWRLIVGTLAGALGLAALLRYGFGIAAVPTPGFTLFSGALLYGAVFMVTDPVSAPKLPLSQWLYSIFIGIMVIVFRYKAVFAGGVGFAILMGNMLAPSLDLWITRFRARAKAGGPP